MKPALALLLGLLPLALSAHDQIYQDAATIVGYGPRPVGSAANRQTRALLEARLQALGYVTERQAFVTAGQGQVGARLRLADGAVWPGLAFQGASLQAVQGKLLLLGDDPASWPDARGRVAVIADSAALDDQLRTLEAAGASGVVVLGEDPFSGRGLTPRDLPVMALPPSAPARLRSGQPVTLELSVKTGRGLNLIAHWPGTTRPELLIGAHYDTVPASPGADDNLSGTLALLEIARRSVGTPVAQRSYFVFFDGEEGGLNGSRHLVQAQPELIAGLRGMINLDQVGLPGSPLRGIGRGWFAEALDLCLPKDPWCGINSDNRSFEAARVNTYALTRGLGPDYHQPDELLLSPAAVREAAGQAYAVAELVLGLPAEEFAGNVAGGGW